MASIYELELGWPGRLRQRPEMAGSPRKFADLPPLGVQRCESLSPPWLPVIADLIDSGVTAVTPLHR
jgi:hypothetical protein